MKKTTATIDSFCGVWECRVHRNITTILITALTGGGVGGYVWRERVREERGEEWRRGERDRGERDGGERREGWRRGERDRGERDGGKRREERGERDRGERRKSEGETCMHFLSAN